MRLRKDTIHLNVPSSADLDWNAMNRSAPFDFFFFWSHNEHYVFLWFGSLPVNLFVFEILRAVRWSPGAWSQLLTDPALLLPAEEASAALPVPKWCSGIFWWKQDKFCLRLTLEFIKDCQHQNWVVWNRVCLHLIYFLVMFLSFPIYLPLFFFFLPKTVFVRWFSLCKLCPPRSSDPSLRTMGLYHILWQPVREQTAWAEAVWGKCFLFLHRNTKITCPIPRAQLFRNSEGKKIRT